MSQFLKKQLFFAKTVLTFLSLGEKLEVVDVIEINECFTIMLLRIELRTIRSLSATYDIL